MYEGLGARLVPCISPAKFLFPKVSLFLSEHRSQSNYLPAHGRSTRRRWLLRPPTSRHPCPYLGWGRLRQEVCSSEGQGDWKLDDLTCRRGTSVAAICHSRVICPALSACNESTIGTRLMLGSIVLLTFFTWRPRAWHANF